MLSATAGLAKRAHAGIGRHPVVRRLLGAAFAVVLVAALGAVLAGQDWAVVWATFAGQDRGRIGLLLGGALLATMAGLIPGIVSWRVILQDLGPPVGRAHVVRIFFVQFLARYLPRGVGLVATVTLAKAAGITFARLASTMALSMIVALTTGLTLGLAAGVHVLGTHGGWLVLAAVAVAVLVVRPRLVNRAAGLLMRLLRRPPPERSVSARGMRLAIAAQSLSWLVSGLHLWLLAIMMGAPVAGSLALCVGAFSLAMVAGTLAFVVPDGIGIRESILTAALVTVLPLPSALVVTLASRVVGTVSDVLLGGVALGGAELELRRNRSRSGNVAEPVQEQVAA